MFPRAFEHLRTKLLAAMLAVVFLLTASVLAFVQIRMRAHVAEDLASALRMESAVYTKVQEARRQQTEQSAALIANMPGLKAMMSVHDGPTIQDASESILENSGADVLILQDPSGATLALHAKSQKVATSSQRMLLFHTSEKHDWWFVNGHLYDLTFAPITAGSGTERRSLGLVALGREVTPQGIAGSDGLKSGPVIFERDGRVLLSSLDALLWNDFQKWLVGSSPSSGSIHEIDLGGERYLGSSIELSGDHPVRLFCLKSYDQATGFLDSLNRALLTMGLVAVLTGSLFGFALSRQITRPLEDLVHASRQMEKGDFEFPIIAHGEDEVAELTRAFAQMRKSLRLSREGMLRSARLEAVGRLAGGIAHDFNNLVMIIKGYSDLVLESANEETRPHIEEIKRAGDRASGLTRQLLAFSRKQVLEPQVLDLNHTVRGMLKMLRLLLGEDIELLTSLSEQIGRVKADPSQIEQVIMNLAVNARDAIPGRGKVIIETQFCSLDDSYAATHNEVAPGDYVLLAVTDNGCGMNSETAAQIFEPFFTTKEPGKGTGLGLSTVYGIVKQSRGHITVYSEIGVGTTFKVYIPAVDKPATATQSQPDEVLPKGHGTVLLAEDEAPLRTLAAETLKRLGYHVLPAGNGLEALVAADQHEGNIDIVVTDIVMPRMGGPELVEKLRRKRPNFHVIFMSGYTEAAVLENANIGKDAILLNKPFSTEMLVRKMREVLEADAPEAESSPARIDV
ncbi:MAG TPA: ATP-binding protein [Terriglobales bacterium]|nr:ATP-binding protein [Terriglobales bacterium]